MTTRRSEVSTATTVTAMALAVGCCALAFVLSPLGCFSLKEPPCAFSCVTPPHRCPDRYSCGSDGLCHREGATGQCALTPPGDGGPAATDSGTDATTDATGDDAGADGLMSAGDGARDAATPDASANPG